MSKYALIKNGIVDDIMVSSQEFADALTGYDEVILLDGFPRKPDIGDPWDGTNFQYAADPGPLPKSAKTLLREKLITDKAAGKTDNPNPVALKELMDDIIDAL